MSSFASMTINSGCKESITKRKRRLQSWNEQKLQFTSLFLSFIVLFQSQTCFVSVQSAGAVAFQKFSSVTDWIQICWRATWATQQMYVSIIKAVNYSVVVTVSCILDHVIRDDSRWTRVIFCAILESICTLGGVIGENCLPRISPVDSRQEKWSTIFITAASSQIAVC